MDSRELKVVDTNLSQEPAIGQWLWAIQDTRRRTLEVLDGLAPALVDWQPAGGGSSIGTILYHLTGIEADWLYVEVLQQSFPPAVAALFPHAIRDEQGHLMAVAGIGLDEHYHRLATVRELLLAAFEQMDLADFRRVRVLPKYDVSPEWVLHHLIQHEAEHRSQLGALRAAAERDLAQQDDL